MSGGRYRGRAASMCHSQVDACGTRGASTGKPHRGFGGSAGRGDRLRSISEQTYDNEHASSLQCLIRISKLSNRSPPNDAACSGARRVSAWTKQPFQISTRPLGQNAACPQNADARNQVASVLLDLGPLSREAYKGRPSDRFAAIRSRSITARRAISTASHRRHGPPRFPASQRSGFWQERRGMPWN